MVLLLFCVVRHSFHHPTPDAIPLVAMRFYGCVVVDIDSQDACVSHPFSMLACILLVMESFMFGLFTMCMGRDQLEVNVQCNSHRQAGRSLKG